MALRSEKDPSRILWRWVAAISAAGLLAGGVWLLWPVIGDLFRDPDALRRFIQKQGMRGPLLFMALQSAQVMIAPIPGHILAVASGYLFGPWWGTFYTVLGVGAGSAIVMTLSRTLGRPLVVHLVPRSALARIDSWAARRGPVFFFVLFMIPFMPDDLACFAIGLSGLPLVPMVILIVLARFPGHFVSAWLGANARDLPPVGWVILAAGGLIIAAVYWNFRRRLEAWLLAHLPENDLWGRSRARQTGESDPANDAD